jgi:hypothetical protein
MEYLVLAPFPYVPEETMNVLEMFKHADDQQEIKVNVLLFPDICQLEREPFIGSTLREPHGLWRDVVSAEYALVVHPVLHLSKDFTGTTADFAYGPRLQPVAAHQSEYLLRSPRRIFYVPIRMARRVIARCIPCFCGILWCVCTGGIVCADHAVALSPCLMLARFVPDHEQW